MLEERRYHHGSLREELLTEGRRLLVEQGEKALTLRELARRAGVSHAAPRRHFADREALLDAIAAQGFEELTAQLLQAQSPGDLNQRLGAYARAHVAFSVSNGPLMEVMFAPPGVLARPDSATSRAAERFYEVGAGMFEPEGGDGFDSLPWVLNATLAGIGALVTSGRLSPERVEQVTDHAVRVLLPAIQERGVASRVPAAAPRPGPHQDT